MRKLEDVKLEDFCGVDDPRKNLRTIFAQNGYRWATSGKAAAWLPAPGEPDKVDPTPPGMSFIDMSAIAALEFTPMSADEIAVLEEVTCKRCGGMGKVPEYEHKCPECHGEGTWTCDECGHEYECKCCHGTGRIKSTNCPDCYVVNILRFRGKQFLASLFMLAATPETLWALGMCGTIPCVYFRVGNLTGAIVGRRGGVKMTTFEPIKVWATRDKYADYSPSVVRIHMAEPKCAVLTNGSEVYPSGMWMTIGEHLEPGACLPCVIVPASEYERLKNESENANGNV